MIPKEYRIWIAVVVAVAVVSFLGSWVFNTVETPEERPWDYGTVPFVPSESHYANTPLPEDIHLPNPEATKAPPTEGGSR